MRHDSGLAASPPVRDILGLEREGVLSFRSSFRCGFAQNLNRFSVLDAVDFDNLNPAFLGVQPESELLFDRSE
jgi:hypothetical protein